MYLEFVLEKVPLVWQLAVEFQEALFIRRQFLWYVLEVCCCGVTQSAYKFRNMGRKKSSRRTLMSTLFFWCGFMVAVGMEVGVRVVECVVT